MRLCLQEGKLNNSRRMAAGFAAGVTEALMIVTPFEVVKIRLQQQQGMNKAALLYKVGDSRYKTRVDWPRMPLCPSDVAQPSAGI